MTALKIVAVLGVTCLASPCRAADAPARIPAVASAARSIANLTPATLALLSSARTHTGQTSQPEPKQFFRTRKGAAVLVFIGAGFGYALYSRFHDEIKSPIRE